MTTTTRVGVTHVDGTDTGPGLRTKANAAFDKFDKTVGRILCTSATRPTTDLFAGMQAYETDTKRTIVSPRGIVGEWYVENQEPIGAGMVRALRPVRNFGEDANHSAFPSAVTLLDGTIMAVWRQGTDHSATRDGIIRKSYSADSGRNWFGTATILTGSPIGTDLRDPCVSLSRDGSKIYLSYFKGTAALGAAGVFFRSSTDGGVTWSAEVRVDNALPWAASSAPVVELNDGTLVIPYYGRSGVETRDSAWVAKSTTLGVSWVNTRIHNGQTAAQDYQEPYISMRGTVGLMAYRVGNAANIGVSSTVDNTANWTGVVTSFAGTGRPTIIAMNDNTWIIVYRRVSNGDAVMRTSRSALGTIWYPERMIDPARSAAGWMTYAGGDKVGPNAYFCIFAQETSTTSSKIAVTYIGEAGARTPFGAVPTDAEALTSNYDMMIFSTVFEQAGGSLVDPWTTAAGALTVTDGYMTSASADNVPDFARVYVGSNDMEVEADIYTSGPDVGFAVVFRMINANSYLMFTVESVGANWRLYKVVGGVATQLFTVAGAMNFGTYHTYRVVAKGNGIWCYVNGLLVTANSLNFGQGYYSYQLSAPDMSAFVSGMYGGVKLNNQGATVHRCRRFVVRS